MPRKQKLIPIRSQANFWELRKPFFLKAQKTIPITIFSSVNETLQVKSYCDQYVNTLLIVSLRKEKLFLFEIRAQRKSHRENDQDI